MAVCDQLVTARVGSSRGGLRLARSSFSKRWLACSWNLRGWGRSVLLRPCTPLSGDERNRPTVCACSTLRCRVGCHQQVRQTYELRNQSRAEAEEFLLSDDFRQNMHCFITYVDPWRVLCDVVRVVRSAFEE